jgi:MAE_28990/MAE_18760-like HEPN
MRDVINLFNERKNEVEIYFEHVKNAWADNASISFRDDSKTHHQVELSLDLKQILLANTFLLLYNLVECTMSGALEAIYKDIKNQKIPYDKIKLNIQEEIINNIRKNVPTSDIVKVKAINDIALDILDHHTQRDKFFSGSVDAKSIKEYSQKYGFSSNTVKRDTRDGINLLTIKNKRNHLAHGVISFKECGQDRSIVEMEEIKNQSLLYIQQILNNINDFVKNKKYLKS